jgi:hypothetical protein
MIFGANTIPYIETQRINGILIHNYNIWGYLENLRQSFTGTTILNLDIPTRQWSQDWFNNFALILDWGLFAINLALYPFRILAYSLRCVLAIAGLPMVNTPANYTLKWLIDLVNGFITFPQIPFV